ncbi:hypothetical protein [Streptosporangium sandarakinum]|uniref:hypothetical protein n=1 Tax=Streptosporangium sandarakinum TaxID=1260955 RepID=UPI0037B27624
MTSPYDHDALWIKAKLFINRAMDDDFRSFDEQVLWAALALELLAKAALSKVSPLLVAEPTEEGTNLLIAIGLVAGDARFTSIKATTLFKRCHKAFKPFDQAEAIKIIKGRNEYLHSSGAGFMAIPSHAWWPRYWAQATTLITALDKDVSDFVGIDRMGVVQAYLEQDAKNVEQRTQALIERAKQRLQQHRDGNLPARVAREWQSDLDLRASLSYDTDAECPACAATGTLEGEDVLNAEVSYNDEPDDIQVTLTIGAEYFSCPTCHLVLMGYKLIKQAGLPEEFEAEGDASYIYEESDYGND